MSDCDVDHPYVDVGWSIWSDRIESIDFSSSRRVQQGAMDSLIFLLNESNLCRVDGISLEEFLCVILNEEVHP